MKKISVLSKSNCKDLTKFIKNEDQHFSFFDNIGWNINEIQNQLNKDLNLTIGLFYNSDLRAFILGDLILDHQFNTYQPYILYVSYMYRRNNYASELINYIEVNKKVFNTNKIYLEVEDNNNIAISFYEKNNFFLLNYRNNYYIYKGIKKHAKCYHKLF